LISRAAVYNTTVGGGLDLPGSAPRIFSEDRAVIRCPDCGAEIDVDEDEVEEGEILSCPECESELEVTQTHPVHLNPISDDLDDEEDEEEEDDEVEEEEEDDEEEEVEEEEEEEEE
jgi:alpha-aminoadipate/glutamate carrier protein LysW